MRTKRFFSVTRKKNGDNQMRFVACAEKPLA